MVTTMLNKTSYDRETKQLNHQMNVSVSLSNWTITESDYRAIVATVSQQKVFEGKVLIPSRFQ